MMMNNSNGPTTNSTVQLHKLKRFLSTLYYFGSDISNDIGERVRALILALVVSFERFFSLSISILLCVRIKADDSDSRFFACWTRCRENEIGKSTK